MRIARQYFGDNNNTTAQFAFLKASGISCYCKLNSMLHTVNYCKMRKLILAFSIFCCQSACGQNAYFTKKTDCAFQFSLPKKFIKSSVISYYSNSSCFDTVLTNRKGTIIRINTTDLTKGGVVDTTDRAKLEIESLQRDFSRRDYQIDSTSTLLINGITFRKLAYHEKKSKFNRGYNYHKIIIFNVYHSVVVFIFIDMQNQHSTNVDNELLKTIKTKW